MSNRITQADVITLYRGLLNRDPEESAITDYIHNRIDKIKLIEIIIASDEFNQRLNGIDRTKIGRQHNFDIKT